MNFEAKQGVMLCSSGMTLSLLPLSFVRLMSSKTRRKASSYSRTAFHSRREDANLAFGPGSEGEDPITPVVLRAIKKDV